MGWDDNRGVSEVLGAMLLFGIIIVALGGYQTFVVPQQNAEIEQKHDAQVDDEFAGIQTAISNAAATGTTRTTSVTLGTQYPVRAAGLNPPTVSGQLSTSTDGELSMGGVDEASLETICGLTPETRSITYRANYNEFDDNGMLAYENGVTYREAGDNILIRNEQELVDGSTIRLFPMTGEGFATGSSRSKQIRFVPGETGTQTFTIEEESNLKLTFPSRLDNDIWENEVLAGADNVIDVTESDGKVTVTFGPDTYTVQCTPVGLGSTPDQNPVPKSPEESDSLNVNPRDGDVYLKSSGTFDDDSPTVTFGNSGEADRELVRMRIPFATGEGQSEVTVSDESGEEINTFQISDEFANLGTTIPAGGDVALTFEFDGEFYPGGSSPGNGWFMISIEQSQGDFSEYRNYFIPEDLNSVDENGGDNGGSN